MRRERVFVLGVRVLEWASVSFWGVFGMGVEVEFICAPFCVGIRVVGQ